MRIATALMLGSLAAACVSLCGGAVAADRAGVGAKARAGMTDVSSQERRARRPITRLRVYPRYQASPDGVFPRYYPGANAVRDCTATYAPEYRPSGTVITPRVNCVWRPG